MNDTVVPMVHPGNTKDATPENILNVMPKEMRLSYAFDMTRSTFNINAFDWMDRWIQSALFRLTPEEVSKIKHEKAFLEHMKLIAPHLGPLLKASDFWYNNMATCIAKEKDYNGQYPVQSFTIQYGQGCSLTTQYVILGYKPNTNSKPTPFDPRDTFTLRDKDISGLLDKGIDMLYPSAKLQPMINSFVDLIGNEGIKGFRNEVVGGNLHMSVYYYTDIGIVHFILSFHKEMYEFLQK